MRFDQKISHVQELLSQADLDGWLLYDFRHSNDLACQFLELGADAFMTRRFFYWIPRQGAPVKIVHGIEDKVLVHVPGEKIRYRTWQELEKAIQDTLKGARKVAMEYSPRNALPYVSKVDAGTVELVRSFGVDVVSSADLLQPFTSVWNEKKLKSHLVAAAVLSQVADQVWELLSHSLKGGKFLTDYQVQQFMLERFAAHQCIAQDAPICAVNAHTADPHYIPVQERAVLIKPGDFVLIDLWCKKNEHEAAYADITRVAVAGQYPTNHQQTVFDIVRRAQKAATELVRTRFAEKKPLRGWEVDQAARDVIDEAGYRDYFIHRTGHNIDVQDHGPGAHMDNYETHDDRLVVPGTCFSIEPGIYLPGEFGVRLEHDVFVHKDGRVQVTGGEQDQIVCLI